MHFCIKALSQFSEKKAFPISDQKVKSQAILDQNGEIHASFETKNSPSWGHNVALELIQGTPPPGKKLLFVENEKQPTSIYRR